VAPAATLAADCGATYYPTVAPAATLAADCGATYYPTVAPAATLAAETTERAPECARPRELLT